MRLVREVGRAEHASTEQLSALLDGRAEPDEQSFLAGHVDRCVICSNELADLRSVRDLLRALPVYLPPRSFTIPIETAMRPAPRRFRTLIPLTRALGAVAAVLCVVLFSMDAMQAGYDTPMAASDAGSAAMHITAATLQTTGAGRPAEPRAADGSAAESAPAADTVAKVPNAPAAPPAPAGALAPARTQVIADTVTATPAGFANRPAESAAQRTAAAAPPPAAQPAPAQQSQGAAAKPQAASAPAAPQPAAAAAPAPQPTSVAVVPTVAAPTVVPAPVQRPEQPSPWLSPIRLWSLGFALVAAALLIGSLVLSRMSRARTGPQDEWTRS
jgi:anti-sigma factor RsiW